MPNLLPTHSTASPQSRITVFAASSLTESLSEIKETYLRVKPKIEIVLNFQASSTLASQIESGAHADIFISAEPFRGGHNFIKNRIVLAVPKKSLITKIVHLNGPYLWVQCAHEVPCGKVTDAALSYHKISTNPISLEPRVSTCVSKLLIGEVDAAFIYRTDVKSNPSLRGIEFSNQASATTQYQIATLTRSSATLDFAQFLQSKRVKSILLEKGFQVL